MINFKKTAFYLLLLLILGSCSENKKYATIYFFDQENFSTPIALKCSDLESFSGLSKIYLTDKNIYDSIESTLEIIESDTNDYSIDTRFRIEFKEHTVCVDYNGNFKTSNGSSGLISNLNQIKNFIQENKQKSIQVTKPVKKPRETYKGELPSDADL